LVQANSGNRLVEPLAELLFLSWGPLQVVADEFSKLDGTERVLIFGSWAARYLQRPGPPPHDLDVLVVGRPTRESVYDAADRAQPPTAPRCWRRRTGRQPRPQAWSRPMPTARTSSPTTPPGSPA